MKLFKKLCAVLIISCLVMALCSGCIITRTTTGTGENSKIEVEIVETDGKTYNSLTEMLDDLRPAVLEIYAGQETATSYSAGSGVIVDKEVVNNKTYYYVLTCHHVIDEMRVFWAQDIYGTQYTSLTLIGGDPESDIAVMRFCLQDETTPITQDKLTVANLRLPNKETGDYLKVGESVYAIGNPLGTLGGTVTQGIISSTNREVVVEGKTMSLIQTDCAINSGNSGGGLFDAQGNLVGIVNAGYSGNVEGLNFAIPSDVACDIATKLMETYTGGLNGYGYIDGRARVMIQSATNLSGNYEMAVIDYSPTPFVSSSYAVLVYSVKINSIYHSEFKVNDIIESVKINDGEFQKVSSTSALLNVLNAYSFKKGDKITFKVSRNNVSLNVPVTLPQYVYMP